MQATTSGEISLSLTDESTVTEAVESFVANTTDALESAGADETAVNAVEQSGEAVVDVVEELAAAATDTHERARENETCVDELEAENQDLRDRVDELEDQPSFDVADESDPIKSLRVEGAPIGKALTSKASKTTVETELADLRADLDASNPTPEPDKPGSSALAQAETPLEQIVALPEHLVDQELSPNQRRARFVATDLRDYATSVPAGWAITSSELRRVLQAAFDAGHTQTVDRVMTILDDLGDDAVRVVKRRGTKRVIFDDALVDRLARLDAHHDVVMEGEA